MCTFNKNKLISGSHMVSLCLSEELKQVTSRHQFHYDIHRIIIKTDTKHFDYVGMIEVTVRINIKTTVTVTRTIIIQNIISGRDFPSDLIYIVEDEFSK